MSNQIYFKIAGYVYLAVLIIFTPCQIFDIINGFWVITQNLQFYHTYVLFLVTALVHGITGHNFETRHPSDDSDQIWFPLISLVLSEEKIFEKVYDIRRTMTTDAKWWVRWAKKKAA